MKKIILTLCITFFLAACVYHPVPVSYAPVPSTSKFDRSWSAAIGALADQGVLISTQDRGAGIIQGKHKGTAVSGDIRHQGDGSVRVQFDTSGDAALIQRITNSYNSRMGR